MIYERIFDKPYGSKSNKTDLINAKIFEYNKELFTNKLEEYVSGEDNDAHRYIKKNKKSNAYLTTIMSFDIETTSYKRNGIKVGVPYIWQIAIQNYVFYGRKFEDIVEMFTSLSERLECRAGRRIIVWVHNLSFEFQFIKKYFKWETVFALDERRPIYAVTKEGIEFRCSYMLSGLPLANIELVNSEIKKKVGDLDYSKVRNELTELTDKELMYALYDVMVVVQYITEKVNSAEYESILDIPYTKTGEVRKIVKNETSNSLDDKTRVEYRSLMERLRVSKEEYYVLNRAFMGGFTHANPNYVGSVLKDVTSADISSSYPAVMVAELYPMSKGVFVDVKDMKEFRDLCSNGLVVFDIKFKNIKSKVDFDHILSYSKCYNIKKAVVDNNRIVSAEEVTTTMTNIDLETLFDYYEWDGDRVEVANVIYYKAGYLPEEIIRTILDIYKDKTELKGIDEICSNCGFSFNEKIENCPNCRTPNNHNFKIKYGLRKSNLNSIYGMMVMDIIRELIEFDSEKNELISKFQDDESLIDEYNKSANRFLFYPWGVFITAYARRRLYKLIYLTKHDHVYSDTDSDKILNIDKHINDINKLNKEFDEKVDCVSEILNIDKSMFRPKDKNGKEHPLGHWEIEETYNRFKTLGAKRYLYEGGEGYVLTCAGLGKKKGMEYLLKEAGRLEMDVFDLFDEGLVVPAEETGKMTSSYVDDEITIEVTDYNGVKQLCKVKSSLYLEPVEFSLVMQNSFLRFLKNIGNLKYLR